MEFWLQLPEHFKKSVVKKLDYKTRCRLRICSKLDKDLVDSCPVTIKHVNFEPRLGNQVYLSIEETGGPQTLLYENCKSLQDVLQDFMFIFKNPKSKVVKLSIAHFNFQRQPDAVNDFLFALFSEIESKYSSSFKLRIEKFSFHWGEMRETNFLELLKKFDSKVFKSIFLRKLPMKTPGMIDELVETEQWKRLEEVRMQDKSAIPLEKLQVNILNVVFHSLKANDVWRYIQNYKSYPVPHQSFFLIHTLQPLPLAEIMELFDVPVENEPLEENNNCIKHTQRFRLPWSKQNILVVKIEMRKIKGTICRKGMESEDFDVLEMNQLQEIV
uniref:FTH domain-containing protein n=1 Tax=Caenorhabditis tropicalis TaxID=1561998 RepID=A0A1I7TAR8_9PELO